MKKIIMALIALTVFASADYEVFVTKTGNTSGGETSLIYFGERGVVN